MTKSIEDMSPEIAAIAEAERRGRQAAMQAGAKIEPAHTAPAAPGAVPRLLQSFFRPVRSNDAAPEAKPRPRLQVPRLETPKRMAKVADTVIYWRFNPGAEGQATPVPATVHSLGNPIKEGDETFSTLNMNVHEQGCLQWNGSVPYCSKPRAGCWCWQSDLK